MKKHFVLLFTLVFALAFSVKGQSASLMIPDDLEGEPGLTVLVPVYLTNTVPFCNIDLYIGFDSNVLTFQGIVDSQLPGNTFANTLPGSDSEILINWFALEGQTLDGLLLYVQFMYHGGETDINFLTELIEIIDCTPAGNDISFTVANGFIGPVPPIPLSNWAIFLGLGLIVGLVVLRMTKVI